MSSIFVLYTGLKGPLCHARVCATQLQGHCALRLLPWPSLSIFPLHAYRVRTTASRCSKASTDARGRPCAGIQCRAACALVLLACPSCRPAQVPLVSRSGTPARSWAPGEDGDGDDDSGRCARSGSLARRGIVAVRPMRQGPR